jgi:hypothetical protein
MATKNNWLKPNIKEKIKNHNLNFEVHYDVFNITHEGFLKECEKTCDDIKKTYEKIYVAFSGGMDSEFVMKCFGNSAIPIIVDTPGNKLEVSYAYHYCKINNITPIVIKKTEAEMLKIFYDEIVKKLNGDASDSVATYIAGKYAVDNGGVLVTGEHAYDHVFDYDFYNDALIDDKSTLYFFMWTPQLVKAMRDEREKFDDNQEFKYSVYDVPFRPKLKYNYSIKYQSTLIKLLSSRIYNPRSDFFINI